MTNLDFAEMTVEVLERVDDYEAAAFNAAKAKVDYDHAVQRLALARDQLMMAARHDGGIQNEEFLKRIEHVRYVGVPIKQAIHHALSTLGHASLDTLAEYLRSRGYQFSGDSHLREVHGAIVKQPWAKRNNATREWTYEPQ